MEGSLDSLDASTVRRELHSRREAMVVVVVVVVVVVAGRSWEERIAVRFTVTWTKQVM